MLIDVCDCYYYYCRICVIAGNISPIDVITHVPILCEESDVPYVYVPSKEVSNFISFSGDVDKKLLAFSSLILY